MDLLNHENPEVLARAGGNRRTKAVIFLIGAALLWGTSYAVTKNAYAVLPPMYVVWWRMIVAFLAFLVLLPRVTRPQYEPGDWKLLGLAALCIPCLYYAFEGYAISFTTASQAGVVAAVMPLVVALSAWVVLRERPTRRTAIAVAISVVGVIILSLSSTSQESAPNPALGNLLEMGAMLAAACATLAIKRLSSRYDPLFLTGMQMAAGCVFFAPLALASGPVELAAIPWHTYLSVAYLGVGCGLAGFGFYNSALKLLPASRAALGVNAIPVVALATGWLALGETMSWLQMTACAMIIASVFFGNSLARSETP